MSQIYKNPLDAARAFTKLINNANRNATKFIDPWSKRGGVDEWDYLISQLQRHGIPLPENAYGLDRDEKGNPAWIIENDETGEESYSPVDLSNFSKRPIAPNQYQLISPGLKNINGQEIYDVFNALHNTVGPNKFYSLEPHKGLNSLGDSDLQALADAWNWKYTKDNKNKYFYRMKTDEDDKYNFAWKNNK